MKTFLKDSSSNINPILFIIAVLLFILVFLYNDSFAQEQQARMSVGVMGGGVAGVVACSTPSGSIVSEGFGEGSTACYSGATGDDATCSLTWTVSGDSVTWHHTLQAGSPTGSCTYGLNSNTANESTERIYYDTVTTYAAATNLDLEFSIYFNSYAVDAGAFIQLISWGALNTGATGYNVTFALYNVTGTYQIGLYGASGSTKVTVSTATWYTVKIHLDATAASSYFQVTGGGSTTCDTASECTFSRSNAADNRYLVIGSLSGEGTGESVDYEIGYITLNAL
jgi:hypothetical protein